MAGRNAAATERTMQRTARTESGPCRRRSAGAITRLTRLPRGMSVARCRPMINPSESLSNRIVLLVAFMWIAAVTFSACGGGGGADTAPSTVTTPATSTTTPTTSSGSTTTTALAYNQDIKPILDSDCIICHGTGLSEHDVQLNTYANVMRFVQAGNANSLLVRVTRSNGEMYPNLTGDRASKSELIRAWVVDNRAVETR